MAAPGAPVRRGQTIVCGGRRHISIAPDRSCQYHGPALEYPRGTFTRLVVKAGSRDPCNSLAEHGRTRTRPLDGDQRFVVLGAFCKNRGADPRERLLTKPAADASAGRCVRWLAGRDEFAVRSRCGWEILSGLLPVCAVSLVPVVTISGLKARLAELVALPGIAGDEAAIAAWIAERLGYAGLEPTIDTLGNVILAPSSQPPRLLVTAHMDQVGYMVSRVEADRARCLAVGDPQPAADGAEPVRVVGDGHPVLAGTIEGREDGGAILRAEGLDRVRIGDSVVFASPLTPGEGSTVTAPALDNRVGCLAALHAALAAGSVEDVAFAWTVREETEQSGVVRVARDLQPAAVVAVDVTAATARDEGYESVVSCGYGPVITLLDEGIAAHRSLLRSFADAAAAVNLRWQAEVAGTGLSEAGQVHQALGIPSLALLVAIENLHSSAETADLDDVVAAIDLLGVVLERR